MYCKNVEDIKAFEKEHKNDFDKAQILLKGQNGVIAMPQLNVPFNAVLLKNNGLIAHIYNLEIVADKKKGMKPSTEHHLECIKKTKRYRKIVASYENNLGKRFSKTFYWAKHDLKTGAFCDCVGLQCAYDYLTEDK